MNGSRKAVQRLFKRAGLRQRSQVLIERLLQVVEPFSFFRQPGGSFDIFSDLLAKS